LFQEFRLRQIFVLKEFSDEFMCGTRIVNSLRCNVDFVADFSEQSATRLFGRSDLFAFNEGAGLFEVFLAHDEEAACGTGLPPIVHLDLFGQLLKN